MCSQFKGEADFNNGKCAILLALHGAGVDAASPFWVNAFNRQDFAWVGSTSLSLFPFLPSFFPCFVPFSFHIHTVAFSKNS
jgi:hypothetical protein